MPAPMLEKVLGMPKAPLSGETDELSFLAPNLDMTMPLSASIAVAHMMLETLAIVDVSGHDVVGRQVGSTERIDEATTDALIYVRR